MSAGRLRLPIGLLTGAVAAILLFTGVLDLAEQKSWDWRMRLFAPGHISNQVAILAVDQASLDYAAEQQGLSWPWPRGFYVPIIEFCRSAGARAIALDVLFTEFSSYGHNDDEELAASMATGHDVTLALGVHQDDSGRTSVFQPRPPLGDPGSLPVRFRSLTPPIPVLQKAAAGLGNVSFLPDEDGIFRRMPVAFSNGKLTLLPLALETARVGGMRVRFDAGTLSVKDRHVPLDHNRRMIIPYQGPAQTIPSYSAASAIQSFIREQDGERPTLDPGLLKGRFVFVGLTAPGLLDLRPTPVDAVYPGVEVHATVLDALLRGDTIGVAPIWLALLLCFLPAVVAAWALGPLQNAWLRALLLPVLLAVVAAIAVVGYRLGVWLPLAGPAAATLLAFVTLVLVDYATEGRQRRFLKHAFRHYLSPAVVEEIVRDPSRLQLGGERKELSLYFSDLAGFSTISEALDPEPLTALLNRYLSEMTEVIQATGGTVDKFEGDAIIAFWNAPLDQPDHALRAVVAALRSLARLDQINPELERLAGTPLTMRIGLHTGSVVVGNLGSRDRFDYSVVGDAANLASRLEGLGKVFGSPLIVSEDAWRAAEGAAYGREIGRVRVVGRRTPCRIFQPGGLTGIPSVFNWWPTEPGPFSEALEAFYDGDLATARERFEALPADPVAMAYRTICARLLRQGLPEAWDGVLEMQSK